VTPQRVATVYEAVGDVFAYACVAAALLGLGWAARRPALLRRG